MHCAPACHTKHQTGGDQGPRQQADKQTHRRTTAARRQPPKKRRDPKKPAVPPEPPPLGKYIPRDTGEQGSGAAFWDIMDFGETGTPRQQGAQQRARRRTRRKGTCDPAAPAGGNSKDEQTIRAKARGVLDEEGPRAAFGSSKRSGRHQGRGSRRRDGHQANQNPRNQRLLQTSTSGQRWFGTTSVPDAHQNGQGKCKEVRHPKN